MTPPPVRVRRARRSDAAAISALTRALWALGGFTSPTMPASHVLRYGFGPRRLFTIFVAESAGQSIGYALVYRGYDTGTATFGLHLQDVYVEMHERRRGVGRMLLERVTEECRRTGARWFTWFVERGNKPGLAFYRALGARRLTTSAMYIELDPRRPVRGTARRRGRRGAGTPRSG